MVFLVSRCTPAAGAEPALNEEFDAFAWASREDLLTLDLNPLTRDTLSFAGLLVPPDPLDAFPAALREIAIAVPEAAWRRRADDGTFALVEHVCHVADLEEEGFGVRIERLESELDPFLPDFRGDAIAKERDYLSQALAPALARFAAARERNRARIAKARDLSRAGTQEGVGRITLGGVRDSMLAHDRGHASELLGLLRDLGVPPPAELRALAAGADG